MPQLHWREVGHWPIPDNFHLGTITKASYSLFFNQVDKELDKSKFPLISKGNKSLIILLETTIIPQKINYKELFDEPGYFPGDIEDMCILEHICEYDKEKGPELLEYLESAAFAFGSEYKGNVPMIANHHSQNYGLRAGVYNIRKNRKKWNKQWQTIAHT